MIQVIFITVFVTAFLMVIGYVILKVFFFKEKPLNAQSEMLKHENENIRKSIEDLKIKAEKIKNDKTIYSTDVLISDIKKLL